MHSKQLLITYKHNTPPLGWKIINDKEVPDEDEQELIDIVRGYRALGFSYKHIALQLTKAHFSTGKALAKFTEHEAKRIDDAETIEERGKRE